MGYCSHTHTHPPSLVLHTLYTVWTFFCSRVLKKVKFFKPLLFPLKIVLGRISSQSFLLITTYQNAYFLRKLRISNSRKHCVDVCMSTQCFKFLHCVDIFCSQVHTSYVVNIKSHNRGPLIVLPLFGYNFFKRCPHWFCTQNKTGDTILYNLI